ncbi:hypothetical protein CQA53_09675 [Helicobacter didelphidarum]|uniref:Uncharacterized protein n=1 Tax=Helicobacter didelphidarum TaxID=2040648 RepID=A0A3D8I9V2_9HELI|nr:hypothetical protein [Helicobacter didelphidarum]RDU61940.1 hypothetical protein CQA53_09675 [Helicobacter didelphidarum]
MKRILLIMLVVSHCIYASDRDNAEWEEFVFVTKKNLGFSLCVREFYKDSNLPLGIAESPNAFNSIEIVNPHDGNNILIFIKNNIHRYLPQFKNEKFYAKYQPWYFVACLDMYNSKEYEDMIKNLKDE